MSTASRNRKRQRRWMRRIARAALSIIAANTRVVYWNQAERDRGYKVRVNGMEQ